MIAGGTNDNMLPPEADAPDDDIDCGPVCQTVNVEDELQHDGRACAKRSLLVGGRP